MQQTKYALEKLVAESPSHQFIPFVSRPEAIAMAKAEHFAADLCDIWLLKNLYAQFLKIMEAPDVVVALKKADLDTCVHQIHQGCEHSDITFRDHIMILIPEIPDVAQKVQSLRAILGNRLQETDKAGFPVCRVVHVQSEVDIRHKI